MRTEGTLRNWNDERGFGFIVTTETKQDVFVHISALPQTGRRPQPGERLAFSIETGHDGKKRASSVNYLDPPTAASVGTAPRSTPQPNGASPASTRSARNTRMNDTRDRHTSARRRNRDAPPRRVGSLLTLLALAGIGTAIVKSDAIGDLLPSPTAAPTSVAPAAIAASLSSGAPENAPQNAAIDNRPTPSAPKITIPASLPETTLPQPTSTASSAYRCDGRTHCSQMTSCAEAEYFLNNCPNVQMDGNNDGEPCEQQWCN
jgi:cold shock CspA family protein